MLQGAVLQSPGFQSQTGLPPQTVSSREEKGISLLFQLVCCVPVQPDLGVPTVALGLDKMIITGPFQTLPFYACAVQ